MAKAHPKPINLALQGGGSHGAFAWGVLDRLLAKDEVTINAVTATSAGAMNAAVLAYGLHLGGHEAAREKLEEFWKKVSEVRADFGWTPANLLEAIPGFRRASQTLNYFFLQTLQHSLSPYQVNPFDYNPLKDVLTDVVDFEELKKCEATKLFITATNVRSGTARVFRTEEICAEHIMASAALPNLYQAVEIDGEAYWDGGYMGNPSLWPLFYQTEVQDLLIVHLNPIVRKDIPKLSGEIANRMNEISFNSSLLKELRAIAFVQKLLRDDWLKDDFKDRLSNIHVHSIRAETTFRDMSLASKYDTAWSFLTDLKQRGIEEADAWIDTHGEAIGKRSTVDLHGDFLDGETILKAQ
ncbi:hypothetical protein PB2503_10589 [Parvularcula bermudensis HTCC2503]|uniref:PNPLA domain-containing protein n=1 Tax=Parvularcula bermudensis (strain ATCC BAA-594 / HTCC2503 / KCTC 12087) TaxID=314260 RepID=E0TGN7_PARBH|nr:patatin-like phospholipase family protein [Parvularcula bermudensis]ADM10169.1 hypothetical protein PB2503_10589 [Parvularcula bermudensis HTCC2503]